MDYSLRKNRRRASVELIRELANPHKQQKVGPRSTFTIKQWCASKTSKSLREHVLRLEGLQMCRRLQKFRQFGTWSLEFRVRLRRFGVPLNRNCRVFAPNIRTGGSAPSLENNE